MRAGALAVLSRRAVIARHFRSSGPAPDKFAAKRPQALALGGAAGGMTGWLGWGAAQILIPCLPGLGVTPVQAGALSMCTLAGITCSSSYKFLEDDAADVSRAMSLGVPATVFAPLGAVAAGKVPGRTLQIAFYALTVVLMPAQAAYFVWKLDNKEQMKPEGDSDSIGNVDLRSSNDARGAAADVSALLPAPSVSEVSRNAVFGSIIGFGSGFLGVAGLPFVVTWYVATSDLTHQQSVGTTFLACTPMVLAGSAAHLWRGNVPMTVFAPLAVGAASGTYLGATAHLMTPTPMLQGALAFSFVVAGWRGAISLRRLLKHRP